VCRPAAARRCGVTDSSARWFVDGLSVRGLKQKVLVYAALRRCGVTDSSARWFVDGISVRGLKQKVLVYGALSKRY
jgi:hypothetical protein